MNNRIRRQLGTTLLEVVISGGLLIGMMVVGVPVFNSIGTAGDGGSAQLSTQAQNAKALMRLQGELLNASTDALDDFGTPRLTISDGAAPAPLKPGRGKAKAIGLTNLPANAKGGKIAQDIDEDLGLDPTAEKGKGKGKGKGKNGKASDNAAHIVGVSARPRQTPIARNSILTFQRVVDYEAVDGAPIVVWSSPVTYQVEDRKLVRIQDGEREVVANHVLAFTVHQSDLGTVRVTLVTEKRASSSGGIHRSANAVEVSPKN